MYARARAEFSESRVPKVEIERVNADRILPSKVFSRRCFKIARKFSRLILINSEINLDNIIIINL